MLAYSKESAVEIGGGVQEIKKQLELGLADLNTSLSNSNVGYRCVVNAKYVEVEGVGEIAKGQSKGLLGELRKPDGKYNNLHKIRKEFKADIVCLVFSGDENTCWGDLNGYFMVCHYESLNSGSIFAHEFGHNLGAIHSDKAEKKTGKSYNWSYRGNNYRTVSNNGGIAIPYFSDNRTVTHEYRYQDPNDNYAWKTERKQVKLGDEHYNNVALMRKQAPIAQKAGESLPEVPDVPGALKVRKVNPDTEPLPAGAKDKFKFIDFTYNESTQLAQFTYNASEIFMVEGHDYKIEAVNAMGEEIGGLGSNGAMNPGYPKVVEASFKKYVHTNGYVGEVKEGDRIQLWYETDGGEPTLRKEIIIGDPVIFTSPDDPNFIEEFKVNESTGEVLIKYKRTREPNIPFKVDAARADGSFAGGTSGSLRNNKTEYRSPGGSKPDAGTVYKLFVNDTHIKTYTIGKGVEDVAGANSNPGDITKGIKPMNLAQEVMTFNPVNATNKVMTVRNQFGLVKTPGDPELKKKNHQFRVVPALNGKSGHVSLELNRLSGYFLVTKGNFIRLEKSDDSQGFNDMASFAPMTPLADVTGGVSFQSSSDPKKFIRHKDDKLMVVPPDNSGSFKEDATFLIAPAN